MVLPFIRVSSLIPFVTDMALYHHVCHPTVCDKDFTLSHALSCPHGAFPIIQHNEIQDLTASLMSKVCHDVQIEPHLHPLLGEIMRQSLMTLALSICITGM